MAWRLEVLYCLQVPCAGDHTAVFQDFEALSAWITSVNFDSSAIRCSVCDAEEQVTDLLSRPTCEGRVSVQVDSSRGSSLVGAQCVP